MTIYHADDGRTSLYAHFEAPAGVSPGEAVSRGERIGAVGESGQADGPHLHYAEAEGRWERPFWSQAVDPGPMSALHNGEEVTYPDHWGVDSWTRVNYPPRTNPYTLRNDGYDQPEEDPADDEPALDDAPSRSTATRVEALDSGHIAYLGLDPEGTLFTRFWSRDEGWSGYTVHGSEGGWSRAAVPAITELSDGSLLIAAVDENGSGYSRLWESDDGWGDLTVFGDGDWSTRGGVALTARDEGRATLMAVDEGGQAYAAPLRDGGFDHLSRFGADWSPLAAPALDSDADGKLHAAMVRDDGRLLTRRGEMEWDWESFDRIGEPGDWAITGGPAILARPDGQVSVAAVDRTGDLLLSRRTGDSWTDPGTPSVDPSWSRSVPPALAWDSEDRIWLAAVKEDGAAHSIIGVPGDGWGDFRRHGRDAPWTSRGVPSLVGAATGDLMLGLVYKGGPLVSRTISVDETYDSAEEQDPTEGPYDDLGRLPGQEESSDDQQVERLAGAERFRTATAVSADAFADGAEAAYVATGYDYPDALAGGAAAAADDAPVLLTGPQRLPEATADELERLDVERITVLGGDAVVDGAVVDALDDIAPTERVAGPHRYATAASISAAAFDRAETALVATGQDFPDGLTAAAAAGAQDAPVLLVGPDHVPVETAAELARLEVERIRVVGGEAVIDPDVVAELSQIAPTDRIAGADRYGTAVEVAATTFDEAEAAYLATGANYPDALAGAAAAAADSAPMLLVDDGVPPAVADELERLAPGRLVVLGGSQAVSDSVLHALEEHVSE